MVYVVYLGGVGTGGSGQLKGMMAERYGEKIELKHGWKADD